MKNIVLKNGQEAILREAVKEDAKSMIEYCNLVGGETDFLTFGKNEFRISIEAEENMIDATKDLQNQIFLVTTVDDEIVSLATVMSNQKPRTKHVGTIGITVKEKYWGQGIGNEMMNYMIEWAKSNGVTRKLSLLVREDNYKAMNLYKKLGFEEEGIIKEDICVNGIYYNTVMMGKLINKNN